MHIYTEQCLSLPARRHGRHTALQQAESLLAGRRGAMTLLPACRLCTSWMWLPKS